MVAVGAEADDGEFQGIEVAEFVWCSHSRTITMAALGRILAVAVRWVWWKFVAAQ
jgi:hypothetical protein